MGNGQYKRVVAYARVSTNKNDQANSLENQTTYFKRELEHNTNNRLIKRNIKGFCDNGIYYDKGISGTKLNRPAFDKLLEDAGLKAVIDADTEQKTTTYKIIDKPQFDIIYVKDTSRFARNIEVVSLLRVLKANNVFVNFLDIGKTTESDSDFQVIEIFLTLAENESADRSRKVYFGYKEGIKQGKIYFGGKMIGYDYIAEENKLVINKKEAVIVRRVFDLYTEEGLGQYRICNQLYDEGYLNSNGKRYGRSTIKRMLQNEKYCGITNSGRYHKTDLFTGKKVELPYDDPLRIEARKAQQELLNQGIVKIEPIISVEQFKKAQEINAKNSEQYKLTKEWHGTTDYAKKVICGCCGAFYRAQGRKYYEKYKKVICVYTCKNRVDSHISNRCKNPSIKEPVLDEALNSRYYYENRLISIDELLFKGDWYIEILSNAINQDNANEVNALNIKIEELKEKRKKLIELYTDGNFDKSDLDAFNNKYTDEINDYTNRIQFLSQGNEAIVKKINEIKDWMNIAKNEKIEIEKILISKKYPKKNRKDLLREVEKIVIDIDGNPNIIFKGINTIDTFINNMDADISRYEGESPIKAKNSLKKVVDNAKKKGFKITYKE